MIIKNDVFLDILKDNFIEFDKIHLIHRQLHKEVLEWCEQNNISISYKGSLYSLIDVWQIDREEHRTWFKLRWMNDYATES